MSICLFFIAHRILKKTALVHEFKTQNEIYIYMYVYVLKLRVLTNCTIHNKLHVAFKI